MEAEVMGNDRSGLHRPHPGVISVWELYTLDEAKRRLQWTDSSLRSARRQGLKLLGCGKRKYVTGREIRRFLQSLNQ
jgi:hypothetical protein